MTTNGSLNRKLRMALCGGGQGAFIGRVHCTAAVLDNRAALVAGALSSNPERAKASAPDYDIQAERAYVSIKELVQKEKTLPADQRIDFVSVATPNHTHFEIAKAAVDAGFNVICDKPMTFDLGQAEELAAAVEKSGVVFAVTHNYTGYPLVRQARQMIQSGELGEINAIRATYIQGWLRSRLPRRHAFRHCHFRRSRGQSRTSRRAAGRSGSGAGRGVGADPRGCTHRARHAEGPRSRRLAENLRLARDPYLRADSPAMAVHGSPPRRACAGA